MGTRAKLSQIDTPPGMWIWEERQDWRHLKSFYSGHCWCCAHLSPRCCGHWLPMAYSWSVSRDLPSANDSHFNKKMPGRFPSPNLLDQWLSNMQVWKKSPLLLHARETVVPLILRSSPWDRSCSKPLPNIVLSCCQSFYWRIKRNLFLKVPKMSQSSHWLNQR